MHNPFKWTKIPVIHSNEKSGLLSRGDAARKGRRFHGLKLEWGYDQLYIVTRKPDGIVNFYCYRVESVMYHMQTTNWAFWIRCRESTRPLMVINNWLCICNINWNANFVRLKVRYSDTRYWFSLCSWGLGRSTRIGLAKICCTQLL